MNATTVRISRERNSRGAVLVHVAFAMLALLALSSFVFDYGVMWVSRGQVQNAADAGALAGAIALAFDYDTQENAKLKAQAVARRNLVFSEPPDVDIALNDVSIEPCPFTPGLPPDTCVRVRAFRNQERSNPLPTFFARLAGVMDQGVEATATARGIAANAARCLRPWAVADRWQEVNSPPWTQSSLFEPAAGDTYDRTMGFSRIDPTTRRPVYHGLQVKLKMGHSGPPLAAGTLSSGWSMALDLPNAETPQYDNNISGCTSAVVGIASNAEQCLTVGFERGCLDVYSGGHSGAVTNPNGALADLIASDGDATWSNGTIVESDYTVSPRIVPIAVFDPALYLSRGYTGTNGVIKVVGLVGFFIEGSCRDSVVLESYVPPCTSNQNDVIGRLVRFPGANLAGGTVNGAFGTIITLVR